MSGRWSAYLLDQNLYTNPFPAASCTQCPVGKFSEAISVANGNSNSISPALHPNPDRQWNWNPVHDPLEEQYFVRLWCKDCTTYDSTSNVATSDAEAGDASQCFCPVGYSGTISAVGASGCTACEAGKYRDRTGFDASNANHHICDLCGVGKYNANTASVSKLTARRVNHIRPLKMKALTVQTTAFVWPVTFWWATSVSNAHKANTRQTLETKHVLIALQVSIMTTRAQQQTFARNVTTDTLPTSQVLMSVRYVHKENIKISPQYLQILLTLICEKPLNVQLVHPTSTALECQLALTTL